ncbi:MAG TPA: sigma-54 dependent transcriptional regulator [Candidatus Kapabacteria bacterium]|nr:sigma-54 dependent transcriptional regulator [Candidatus Kapabacteria bacterium]
MNEVDFKLAFLNEIKSRFGIVGNSPKILEALEKLLMAAPTDLNVLITGETGTGKEVFAKAVHGMSNRKKEAFVSVNCAAIPENLLEAELFGNEKGAYTGAVEQRVGFFEAANNGTIFLDEIGDMPLLTQVKLLRVLESGEYTRLGSSTIRKVNARVVAATNRNLEAEIRNGNFRQDLYFRLNSVQIVLPPLREHPADIPLLVEYIAGKTSKKLNFLFKGIDADSISILQSLHWPGNIRELRNMVETIVTLEKGEYITPKLLQKYIPMALPAFEQKLTSREYSLVNVPKFDDFSNDNTLIFKTLLELKSDLNYLKSAFSDMMIELQQIKSSTDSINLHRYEEIDLNTNANEDDLNLATNEKNLILLALRKYNGNRRLASEALGLSQRTLYRKLQDYDIN